MYFTAYWGAGAGGPEGTLRPLCGGGQLGGWCVPSGPPGPPKCSKILFLALFLLEWGLETFVLPNKGDSYA